MRWLTYGWLLAMWQKQRDARSNPEAFAWRDATRAELDRLDEAQATGSLSADDVKARKFEIYAEVRHRAIFGR